MRWMEYVARIGKERGTIHSFGVETSRKRPPVRPRRRLEDNIKMDLKKSFLGVVGRGLD